MKSSSVTVGSILLWMWMLFFAIPGVAQQKTDPCGDETTGQIQMDRCARQQFEHADRQLNETYTRVIQKFSVTPSTIKRIHAAQRAWIRFRDAEIEALFPSANRELHGTVYPMCRWLELLRLTRARTVELSSMIAVKNDDSACTPRPLAKGRDGRRGIRGGRESTCLTVTEPFTSAAKADL
jgi:uncharacterized protein YecT (DUF1311 family)